MMKLIAPSTCGRMAAAPRHVRGLTLIELMVAIAVGLIVSLAITGAVLTMGKQFRVVGATAAAQGSAQIALSLIDEAGRSAGAGLYSRSGPLCPTLNIWRDGVSVADGATFMAVNVVDGGDAGTSDRIVFTGSAAVGALSATPLLVNMAAPGDALVVSDAGNLVVGDFALVGSPAVGQPCTLFRVTAVSAPETACGGNADSCRTLTRAGAAAGFNPPDPSAVFANAPLFGFENSGAGIAPVVFGNGVVNRIGPEFRQLAFEVQCDSLIQYNAFSDAPTCTENPLSFAGGANALATDVVLMHAQYGVSVGAGSDIVTEWVDATGGTWAAPTVDNAARVKAVRVVVVVRSKEADANEVTAASCTNTGGVVNTGPCSFQDADAPAIDLSGVSVPAGRSWRNYRYRVHQAVVPLRNVIWSF